MAELTAASLVFEAGTVAQSSSDDGDAVWFAAAALLIGLGLIYYGFKLWRIKRLVQDTPTEKVRSMAVGRTELNGTVKDDGVLYEAPFSEHDNCVYTSWSVQEYRKQHDNDPDEHGDDYEWETIASGTDVAPFWLEDDTGRVRVKADEFDPKHEISDELSLTRTVGRGAQPPDPIYDTITNGRDMPGDDEAAAGEAEVEEEGGLVSKAVDTVSDMVDDSEGKVGTSNNKRKYKQEILPVDTDIYLLGSAQPLPVEEAGVDNASKLAIEEDDATELLLISDMGEDALTNLYSWKGPAAMVGGIALAAVGLYLLLTNGAI